MAIKTAQANYDNGTSYDVLHYETQVSQVKILDGNGSVTSNIDEMLLSGKSITSVDLNTIKTSGKYKVKGGANTPSGIDTSKVYILTVDAIDVGSGVLIVHQRYLDHLNMEVYQRTFNGTAFGAWVKIGKTVADQVSKIGTLTNLYTTQKTSIVDAINELSAEIQVASEVNMTAMSTRIDGLKSNLDSHNHDTKYLSLNGGNLKGTTTVANNSSFAGKNTGGTNLNLAKVGTDNRVVVGDKAVKAVIESASADLKVSNGTTEYKIFHAGNMGAGTGLDADLIDGIQGSQLARRDASNYFTSDQIVDNGKSLIIRASEGSSQAGSLFFRDGNNVNKGRILVGGNGDMNLYSGSINGHTFKGDGDMVSTYDHVLDASDRQVKVRFRTGASDEGIGFYLNTSSNRLGLYDWKSASFLFTTDRSNATMQFANAPDIQGHKLSIQSSAPSSPSTGDIWIDI